MRRAGSADRNDVLRNRRPGGATPDPDFLLTNRLQAILLRRVGVVPRGRNDDVQTRHHRSELSDDASVRGHKAQAVLVLDDLISFRKA